MKNAFLDKAKSQIPQVVKANLRKTLALCSAVLALTAINSLLLTTAKSSGAAAGTETRAAIVASPAPVVSSAPRTPDTKQSINIKVPLRGYVDMHTHPMSHLGFGKKLMHGAPDVGSIVPKGTFVCNTADFRAKTMGEALAGCDSTHGGWGTDNTCGDHLRAAVINHGIDDGFAHKVPPEQNLHGDHHHPGYPAFKYWPHQTSKLHQQMWVDWIKRAHEGGLRVMVALSVNNQLLADAINGDSPKTDKASSDLQITEIKSFVKRHNDFMEVAYAPGDLRRIVLAGKLAVILGMEIDDFGGFNGSNKTIFNLSTPAGKKQLVKAEIQRVYDLGVRYLFPIHLTNNVFGGAAVYNVLFNFANKHNTGQYMDIEHSPDPTIQYDINFADEYTGLAMLGVRTLLEQVGEMPAPCVNDVSCLPSGKVRCCSPALNIIKNAMALDGKWPTYNNHPKGHINALGLTPLGEYAMQEMMKLGMIIDLDHMGLKARNDALELAEGFNGGYPVNLGHNGLRNNAPGHSGTERNVDAATILRIAKLKGVFGLGTSDLTPDEFIKEYRKVSNIIEGWGGLNGSLGLGTDANGLEPLPKAFDLNVAHNLPYANSDAFYAKHNLKRLNTNGRIWDYPTEGVAHYGLMYEFLLDVKSRTNGPQVYDHLWNSAEYFAQMWEKCEKLSGGQ